jgi:hypothetical protein
VKKSDREIMEILEAFDATGCAHSAAQIAGVDPKTVRRYVAARDAGRPVDGAVQRLRIIDPFLGKVEEWVDRSDGTVRADVVHGRLQVLGFTGDERTTRRAVAEAKQAWRSGNRRRYRPWITEPGLWLQFDWGTGPVVFGPEGRPRPTLLFCAWLAWSRFRVVLPTWDRRLGTLLTCLDTTMRRLGGAPTYALTDNEKTVTVEHVAGVPVRHPMIVAAGRHYGLQVHTCVRFDPESKGGSEATVRIAKADLVPTKANLLSGYNSFAELAEACEQFCENVNAGVHRETNRVPAEALVAERSRLHALPVTRSPRRLARPARSTPIRRSGSGRCATPPHRAWSAARCGSAPTATSWSSPPTWMLGSRRWPGISCRRRASRGLTCPTTPTIPSSPTAARSHPGRVGPATRRRRSLRSVRVRTAGWSRPPQSAPNGSGRR